MSNFIPVCSIRGDRLIYPPGSLNGDIISGDTCSTTQQNSDGTEQVYARADPEGKIQPWPPSSLAVFFGPLQQRNTREIQGNIY